MARIVGKSPFNVPRRALIKKAHTNNVYFGGEFINLSSIAIQAGVTKGAISLVFSGKRQPSLRLTKAIAKALNMDLRVFIEMLEDYTSSRRPYRKAS